MIVTLAVGSSAHAGAADNLIDRSGVKGGLVVHIGCGDGTLTAALHANDSYLVQGLDTSARNVAATRQHIQSKKLYSKVSVRLFDGKALPYVDDLANLVVVSSGFQVSDLEIKRVLAPLGVAIIGDRTIVKPWPDEIDEWSHYLNGADNNPVADDEVVDTPRRLKWACGPLWSRSHEQTSSISVVISAQGRLFYVVDEGVSGRRDLPESWMLIARDAFNGVLLWKKPLREWGKNLWGGSGLRNTPGHARERLVAGDGKLFMMKGKARDIVAYDAATGELLREYKGADDATVMRYSDGVLVVQGKGLTAFDADSGASIWSIGGVFQSEAAVSNGKVYYGKGSEVVCVGLKDGKEQWKKSGMKGMKGILVDENYLAVLGGAIQVLDAGTGETIWTGSIKSSIKRSMPFISSGRLWSGHTGIDLKTGKKVSVDPTDVYTLGHHPRCYPIKPGFPG